MRASKVVLVLALVMMAVSIVPAQVIPVTTDFWATPRTLSIVSPSDSITGLSIRYDGQAYPELKGQLPDSIKIACTADGDSTYNIFYRFKARHYGAGGYTSVLLDSLKSTTAVTKSQQTLVANANFWGYEDIGISLYAQTGTAVLTANASELWFRYTRYFHKPGVK